MGQQEVLDVLGKAPEEWLTRNDICAAMESGKASTCRAIRRLRMGGYLDVREMNYKGTHMTTFQYRLKKRGGD